MKKIIIAIIMVFISIGYSGAEDKQTVDPARNKKLIPSKGYLPLPAKYKYSLFKKGITNGIENAGLLDCIEGQRRIISYGRMDAGDEGTKTYGGYHSTVWVTIQRMEQKGYTGLKHKVLEVSDLDYH